MNTSATLKATTPSTTKIVMTRTFDPRQLVFDAIIASGVESGAGESYGRLAELLRSQQ